MNETFPVTQEAKETRSLPPRSPEEDKERLLKTNEYLRNKERFFNETDVTFIKKALLSCNDEAFERACRVKLRNPAGMRLLSLVLGTYGVDRFLIGDIKLGCLKLFTCGGFLILWFVDIIYIKQQTKYFNAVKICNAIAPGWIKQPSLLSRINTKDVRRLLKNSLQSFRDFQDSLYIN